MLLYMLVYVVNIGFNHDHNHSITWTKDFFFNPNHKLSLTPMLNK